jgi:uncharacterized hydrophobic protein (TIGR00271 family)
MTTIAAPARVLRVTEADIGRMRDQLFFEGPEEGRRFSRFWILLLLAAVIASAGVIGDSTATVIGAMIVAPLMTPILGMMLAIVLADRGNLVRSIALVLTGAVAVVVIAYLIGIFVAVPVVAEDNSQVAARVSPRLVDLVAALATGAVGSFALTRSDVSDTLPGVAIAISLVPPLAVAGLALESGAPDQASGALLLFLTNVSAILASGIVVMGLYRVFEHRERTEDARSRLGSRAPILVIAVLVLLVIVPLAVTGARLADTTLNENAVEQTADVWAAIAGWDVVTVGSRGDTIVVRATGPLPAPDPSSLRAALDRAGLEATSVALELVPGENVLLPGDVPR